MKDAESTAALRELVEAEIDIERWEDGVGYLRRCPGEYLHNGPSSGSPILRLRKTGPWVACFHTSCKGVLADVNQRLAEMFADYCAGHDIKIELTPEQKAEFKFGKWLRRLTANARLLLAPKIIVDVPTIEWMEESPYKLWDVPVKDSWALYLPALFQPKDLIWIGSVHESGREFKHCFRTVAKWLHEMPIAPGPQICLAPFKETTLDQKRLVTITQDDDPEEAAKNLLSVTETGGTALLGMKLIEGSYRRAAENLRFAI